LKELEEKEKRLEKLENQRKPNQVQMEAHLGPGIV
jgi:hypothetical protein